MGQSVHHARVDAAGAEQGPDRSIIIPPSGAILMPKIAAGPGEFGVACVVSAENRASVHFLRIDPDAHVLSAPIQVSAPVTIEATGIRLQCAGNRYALPWGDLRHGRREIYHRVVEADGLTLGPETRVTDAPLDSWQVSTVWDGEEFTFVWADQRDDVRGIWFARGPMRCP